MTHDIIHVTPCMQEKVADWNKRFSAVLGVTCQELTSDTDAITNAAALSSADIICTTPEKFGQHTWHIPFHIATIRSARKFATVLHLVVQLQEVHMLSCVCRHPDAQTKGAGRHGLLQRCEWPRVAARSPDLSAVFLQDMQPHAPPIETVSCRARRRYRSC